MLAINYDKEQKIFNLSNGKISYILGIEKDCYVKHIYFGKYLSSYNGSNAQLFYRRKQVWIYLHKSRWQFP